MKKMIWLTIITVLFLVLIAPLVLSLALKIIPSNVQPSYDSNVRVSLYKDRELTQEFIANNNNLTSIGTSIRNPNLKNKKDVIFNLYENNILIRTSKLNGLNLEDGSFVRYDFPPIHDSLGKKYTFTISSPDAGAEETIELFIRDADSSSGIVEYMYLGEIKAGGIPMVQYYLPINKAEVLKSVLSNFSARFLFHRSQI
ncbi:MAG: hypothetical protein UT58_C0031G0003 [Microgenomates group bacterium GW2011_GWC1_39_7b]|nr:MAG: hypothetical protein UT58_C0031G0003 [Microgenomates group bacterium GW2011_GWC1_39_7b]